MKKVHSCEPEQGVFLGESDEETDEESSENYIDYWDSSYQQEDLVVSEEPKETKWSYVFYTNEMCVAARCINNGEGQLS